MSEPQPRTRSTPLPEPTDDMRVWLRNEGTIVCELPDGSRLPCTAAEYFAGPHLTETKPQIEDEANGPPRRPLRGWRARPG